MVTVTGVCSYDVPGNYTPKIIVEKGSVVADARTTVAVFDKNISPEDPKFPRPTPAPTVTPSPLPPDDLEALKAKIDQLLALIAELQKQLDALRAGAQAIPTSYRFVNVLRYGQQSQDVSYLQIFLKSQGAEIYPEGIINGSFGPKTRAAVIRFQEKYSSEILVPVGLTQGSGIVGQRTNIKINQILGR